MVRFSKDSILLRLGIAMATITTLAFVSMVSSVIIAEMSQGVATAINQAGSLRMQSYRIASSLTRVPNSEINSSTQWAMTNDLVQEFETRLTHSRLVSVLSDDQGHQPSNAYLKVKQAWFNIIKPLLTHYLSATAPAKLHNITFPETLDSGFTRSRYLQIVDPFVAKIDRMVKLLEDEAESKIRLLRLIHIIALFLTLFIAFAVMYLMKTRVQTPLYDLLNCAERARHGDFSTRTPYTGDDELGQLSTAFNVMTNDLSKIYTDLEQRVREKTADLERSNRSLELLYNTTKSLNAAAITDTIYTSLLQDIQQLLDVGPGSICLTGNDPERAFRMATTRTPVDGNLDICNPPNCPACFADGDSHYINVQRSENDRLRVHSTPIIHQDQHYGVLLTEVLHGKALKVWQKRLLEAVADHIGIALDATRRTNESRRLMLLEERGVIARELHDSLAQSLSYLKIQITRLNVTLAQPGGEQKIRPIIDELKEGTNSAYLQLRELLTTFRLKMDGGGLNAALSDTVEEFRSYSGIAITLNNQLDAYLLDANEEIHVLHVVREAISNVVNHSNAKTAWIDLRFDNEPSLITVTIDDNGIGICEKAERVNHYGLAIMNERANGLGGQISIRQRKEGGTRVRLEFKLAHHERRGHQETDQKAPTQGVDRQAIG